MSVEVPGRVNEYGQPIGADVPGWSARVIPRHVDLTGRDVRLVDLTDDHIAGLFEATCGEDDVARWTYIPEGPFRTTQELAAYLHGMSARPGTCTLAILDGSGAVLGTASYLNTQPGAGSIEVGAITYGPALAGTRGSTEAMYRMARHAFDDLGYRRYEWKCDSLNAPSRRAAQRLGFTFEGIFRNALVYKGRNRDTAWFSMTDAEWPALRDRLERWLDPANFDPAGRQHSALG